MVGFCKALVNPTGPVQEYVVPAGAEPAIRFKLPPVHKGLLLGAVIVGGAAGLTKVNGPILLEMHPFSVTKILE